MQEYNDRLKYLLDRFADNISTKEEFDELFGLIGRPEEGIAIRYFLMVGLYEEDGMDYDRGEWAEKFRKMFKQENGELHQMGVLREMEQVCKKRPVYKMEAGYQLDPERRSLTLPVVAAAAAIMILLISGAYFFLNKLPRKGSDQPVILAQGMKNDLAPGGNKAILTLANGSSIVLDSAHTGVIVQQGNAKVIKLNNGQLAYDIAHEKPMEVLFNTLATPRGGQYRLLLPDGSEVWLNASSSIRYPTVFRGKERRVEITGEVYFEVAKNTSMPFKVFQPSLPGGGEGMEVEVLGTHFNINAYENGNGIRTTLLEGAVRINMMGSGESGKVVKPGEQAVVIKGNSAIEVIPDADVDLAMAWKNGYTAFKSADIKSIMQQVERWYDVDVIYEGVIPVRTFTGKISRKANVSELFKILEESNIHFRIGDKKIIVTP